MTERRCEECLDKITVVSQKVENHDARIGHLETNHSEHDKAFGDFYTVLKDQAKEFRSDQKIQTDRISSIVMDGMEAHQNLKDEMADKYITKSMAIIVGTVSAFVGGVVLSGAVWFFTNVSTKEVAANNYRQLSTVVELLTEEIHLIRSGKEAVK